MSHRKEGDLLSSDKYEKNFYLFGLLYSLDPSEKLNNVGSAEKKVTYFLLPNYKSTVD